MRLWERVQLATRVFRNSATSIGSSRELHEYLIGRGVDDSTGMLVTPDTAMRLSSVYSCVRVVSEDMAKLPLHVYKRLPKGRERADDHPVAALLRKPNPWQTGFEFREMMQSHIELTGNFFALKTVVRGETRELLPLAPGRMEVTQRPNLTLKYEVTWPTGMSEEVPPDRVFHHRGLSLDGILGVSPVGYQRESMGLGMALTRFGSKMFSNGAMVGGVLEHPRELSEPAMARLRDSFDERYSGVNNAHKTMILEEGLKFSKTSLAADEAQFLESRKFSRTEIAGFYRVPPHMIGDLERATFSNIEQQSLDYVQNGLMPRAVRLEWRLWQSLLRPSDQAEYFFEHMMDALLRGDFATRMNGYRTATAGGWLSRNEVREKENLNPGPPELDEFLVPLNMVASDQLPDPTKEPATPPPGAPNDPSQPQDPFKKQSARIALMGDTA